MFQEFIKNSVLIPSQLPEFIREDSEYKNFVSFIEAYYEWMEKENNLLFHSKNLPNYSDIDNTTDEFLKYYTNTFLPNFPEEILADKNKLVKIAKELYKSKGTPSSYQFLFRVLYNSDFDIFYTRDAVLKASDGDWYIAKSLKLATSDERFLNINNLKLFGETSKSIAVVESSVYSNKKIEVFISNIDRLFQSGEIVRVVDSNLKDVLFDGEVLRSKIVGQLSQIRINPGYRGQFYASGDPVIVYDGLNSNTGIGAIAEVGVVTTGSIDRINVIDGGLGYRPDPNTVVSITNAPGAKAIVGSMDPDSPLRANVDYLPMDVIKYSWETTVGNTSYSFLHGHPSSNANTRLVDAFSFNSFTTYPISSMLVINGGGGIRRPPKVLVDSIYLNEEGETEKTNPLVGDDVYLDANNYSKLSSYGILGPIMITDGGENYAVNDTITFIGGMGYGAYANVTQVDGTGKITKIEYVNGSSIYPKGGMGYINGAIPSVNVISQNVNAANAKLYVSGILGTGATFDVVSERIGSISTINLIERGEDYISTPNVSLKVQDIVVTNTSISNPPQKGDIVYQGNDINNYSYLATVNSISLLVPDQTDMDSIYNLRVFNYKSKPNTQLPLIIQNKNIFMEMANVAWVPPGQEGQVESVYNESGIRYYGDSRARATASFLNGLVLGEGQYLNNRGQPSGFSILQSLDYNNFTYKITVEKEIEKYRNVLLSLLHPVGTKVLGRYKLQSHQDWNTTAIDAYSLGKNLIDYTGYAGSTATIYSSFTNKSNNIIKLNNLAGANIANFIFEDDYIKISTQYGPNIKSKIVSVDYISNTVTVEANTWLTFSNVAIITANAGSNAINIVSLTNYYDIINNGEYSNTQYPLKDIVHSGDYVLISNNTSKTVSHVDYVRGIIYLTSNLSANSRSYLNVNRNYIPTNCVTIYGPVGVEYTPELLTEDGRNLITEDGRIILVG